MLAYLAAAWLAVQVLDVVSEPWGLSESLVRALHAVLLFGAPVVVVVAWFHGERGRQRMGWREVLILAVVLVVTGVGMRLMLGGAPGAGESAERASGADGRIAEDRLVVVPFANRTGVDSLAVVGEWAAEWIAQEATSGGVAFVVPAGTARAAVRHVDSLPGIPETEHPRLLAEETGAGILVVGSMFREGGDLVFQPEILDWNGRLLRSLSPTRSPIARPSEGFSELRERIVGSVATVIGSDFADFTALQSQPPSYRAYKAFARGSRHFGRSEYDPAIEAFEEAARLDSAYTLPLIYLAFSHVNGGDLDPVPDILARIETRVETLAPYDLHFYEFARSILNPNPDWEAALRAALELRRIAPGARTDYDVGASLYRLNRPRAAADDFATLDPTRGELRDWMPYWFKYTGALHMLEDHAAEDSVAKRAREIAPDRIRPRWYEARARIALGEPGYAIEAMAAAIGTSTDAPYTAGHMAEELLLELTAHGFPEQADSVYAMLLGWLESLPPASRDASHTRADLAFAGVVVGRLEEAERVLVELMAEGEESPVTRGLLGIVLALTGRPDEAREIRNRLASEDGVYDVGHRVQLSRGDAHPKRWAAEVSAALGDEGQAMDLLREGLSEGLRHGVWMHVGPGLRLLRGTSDFDALLAPRG